jgi:DNA helicase II / ATP-dependent DNA helicase PcrA
VIRLNVQQRLAVDQEGDVIVTACPGSGKTRVLAARVIRGLAELESPRGRVVALTFTNRATDEIKSRLDSLGIDHQRLWAGTIHSFALEWVLRPYAPYDERLRYGFQVADDVYCRRLLTELKSEHGKPFYFDVCTARDGDGACFNETETASVIVQEYRQRLRDAHLIDYDDILFFATKLLRENDEIACTVGDLVDLLCVDEIQDTQDLQYAILAAIYRAALRKPTLFFVGDADQCIYESLGAVLKSPEEIAEEFAAEDLCHLELTGNYRSTQRIIDFYRLLRPSAPEIKSLAEYSDEVGQITFQNKTVAKDELPDVVAGLIRQSLDQGVPPNEICVVAPQWWHVRGIGRSLSHLLPDVDFDAPGLSPIHGQRENVWFKIARLMLSTPGGRASRTRSRWAAEILRDLRDSFDVVLPENLSTPRQLLRFVNSTQPEAEDGLDYLRLGFEALIDELGLDFASSARLASAHSTFFEQAEAALQEFADDALRDAESFRKLFRHPAGVVINTCHGVKGEEYDTVIAFGLLRGYVPNWGEIIDQPPELGECRASRLLFVIGSRAKRQLHLIAESGRLTARGREYETTHELAAVEFDFDPVPRS